jgi:hypothetical protein
MQVRPSTADQPITAAPWGNCPSKKKCLVLASKRKQPTPSDQVTTKLFLHRVPCCSPGLVTVKLVFRRLFEALQCPTQAAKSGADIQPARRLQVPSMRKMLAPRCVIVLTCALLLVTFAKILMIHLTTGNLWLSIHQGNLASMHSLHMLPRSLLLWE